MGSVTNKKTSRRILLKAQEEYKKRGGIVKKLPPSPEWNLERSSYYSWLVIAKTRIDLAEFAY